MACLLCSSCGKSLIGPILEQEALMRNILDDFVEYGHLHLDEMIDSLIAREVLQPKHHEILTVPRERSHKARQLWMLLLRVPPQKFKDQVEPVLKALGLWKDRVNLETKAKMCLRCVIEYMLPIEEFADKLVVDGFLKVTEYRDAVKSSLFEFSKWELIFDCLKREHINPRLLEICQSMLEEFEIPVPPKFTQILEMGLPCACSVTSDVSQAKEGQPADSTAPLCSSCAAALANCSREDLPTVPETSHVDFEHPADDVNDDVELRPRSCCNFRKQRMAQTRSFQRDVMKTKTPAKRLSG